jgi:tetratricopeptide (TPR) repeat protein
LKLRNEAGGLLPGEHQGLPRERTHMSDLEKLPAKTLIERGICAWERADYEAALEFFQAVMGRHPGFADVHNKAGLCLAMLGDPEAALKEFDEALKISDTYAEAHLNRAIVLQGLGHFEEARKHLIRADELDRVDSDEFPSDVGHKIAIAHAKLGDLYLVADHPEEAAEEYRKALAVRGRFLDIRSKYAEALMGMGRWKEAQDQLETILERNPEFTSARLRLGLALHRQGDAEGARREWERCVQDDSRDMRARAYLASLGGGGGFRSS